MGRQADPSSLYYHSSPYNYVSFGSLNPDEQLAQHAADTTLSQQPAIERFTPINQPPQAELSLDKEEDKLAQTEADLEIISIPSKTGKASQGTKRTFGESFIGQGYTHWEPLRNIKRQKGRNQKYKEIGKHMETALKKTFYKNPIELIAIMYRWL